MAKGESSGLQTGVPWNPGGRGFCSLLLLRSGGLWPGPPLCSMQDISCSIVWFWTETVCRDPKPEPNSLEDRALWSNGGRRPLSPGQDWILACHSGPL